MIETTTHALLSELQRHAERIGKNPTDYAVSQLMETSTARISAWRRGIARMSEEAVVDACELIWPGDDAMRGYWLLCLKSEIATQDGPEGLRRAWSFLLKQTSQNAKVRNGLKKTAAAALLAAGVGFGGIVVPVPAQASADSLNIMLNTRRRPPTRCKRCKSENYLTSRAAA